MSSAPNPLLNPSLKPRSGRSWKRMRRIEIVARLEAAFIPDADIARHLGVTVQALHHIKKTPEFLAKRITLSTGILSQYDQNILLADEAKSEEIKELSALALTQAKRMILDPTNPHHGKAVFEILDRDRATSKISRQEHALAKPVDPVAENKRSLELLAMLSDNTDVVDVNAVDDKSNLSTTPYLESPVLQNLIGPKFDTPAGEDDSAPEDELDPNYDKGQVM